MKYIGIDVGINEISYAVIDDDMNVLDFDIISNPCTDKLGKNKIQAALDLVNIFAGLEDEEDMIGAVEMTIGRKLSPQQNLAIIVGLAAVSGAVYAYLNRAGVDTRIITPSEWKGRDRKIQTRNKMIMRFGSEIIYKFKKFGAKAHNVYDALGIAEWLRRKTIDY